MFLSKKIAEITDRLNERYGEKEWERWRSPLGELIRTILSQNTTDTNSLRNYADLKDNYSTWEELLAADVEEIAEVIKSGGLANSKAKKIKRSLTAIKKREGSLSLEFLKDLEPGKADDYLQSLYGVGPKTAACVLLFSFNFPIMPVDTHVHRVSNRLGLVTTKTPSQTQQALTPIVPAEDIYSFHLNLIEHGRKICKATNPQCEQCFLNDLCDYYSEQRTD
ncbi:MAG: endonuclease III [Candidatus Heimdallarchaeota archaeon]|nr:endonuclease III [Candidatus Heimdallarchaeota archaeon]